MLLGHTEKPRKPTHSSSFCCSARKLCCSVKRMWKFVCQPYGNAFSAHPTAIWAIRSLTKTHVDVYPSGRRCRGPGQIHCPHAHEHQGLLLSFLPSFLVVPAGIFHWSCVFFFLGSALPDIPLPIVSVLRSVSKCSVCFLLCFSVKCTDSCHQTLLLQCCWANRREGF